MKNKRKTALFSSIETQEEAEAVSERVSAAEACLKLSLPGEALKEIENAPVEIRDHPDLLGVNVRALAQLGTEENFDSLLHRYFSRMRELQDEDPNNPKHVLKILQHIWEVGSAVQEDAGTVFALEFCQMSLLVLPEHYCFWFVAASLLLSLGLPKRALWALDHACKLDPVAYSNLTRVPEVERLISAVIAQEKCEDPDASIGIDCDDED